MKWLEFLKPEPRVKPLPPIKTIQSPGVARKERTARPRPDDEEVITESGSNPGAAQPAKIDPMFEDTGSLEITAEPDDKGNPYDTQSWQLDKRKGLQRVDNLKKINREPVDRKAVTNPYDTGIIRKGW
jgi:hypothetical protein